MIFIFIFVSLLHFILFFVSLDNSYLVSVLGAAEDSFVRLMLARSEATLGEDIWIGMKRQEYVVNVSCLSLLSKLVLHK